jgi:hypothetical protein
VFQKRGSFEFLSTFLQRPFVVHMQVQVINPYRAVFAHVRTGAYASSLAQMQIVQTRRCTPANWRSRGNCTDLVGASVEDVAMVTEANITNGEANINAQSPVLRS